MSRTRVPRSRPAERHRGRPARRPRRHGPRPGWRNLRQVQRRADQGRVDLRRADDGRGLDDSPRQRPAVRPEDARLEGEDHLQGEHPTGPKLAQTVASLVRDGNKIIFATSFGQLDKKIAAKYPDVYFEQATGTDLSKNLAEFFGAGEDSIYLSGMAAGAATKNGKIGYIVPFGDPRGDPPRQRVRARRAGASTRRRR